MFQQTKKELKDLTPHLAEKLLRLNTFEGQRNIRPKHINYLANTIREGLFLIGEIGIALYQNGGDNVVPYLVNGQHQCEAVITANKTVPIVLTEYDCPTLDDVSLLYRQFDSFGGRTLQDIVKMEMMGLGVDWPLRIASLVVTAAAVKEKVTDWHKTQKISLLRKYIKHGHFLAALLDTAALKHMGKSPVVCAILITWEKCQRDAETFWTDVRDGVNLTKNSPAYILREFLKDSSLAQGRGASVYQKSVTFHEMLYRCIVAWNAYRRGDKLKIIKYYPAKPVPSAQ